jgi:hypothetical protein
VQLKSPSFRAQPFDEERGIERKREGERFKKSKGKIPTRMLTEGYQPLSDPERGVNRGLRRKR